MSNTRDDSNITFTKKDFATLIMVLGVMFALIIAGGFLGSDIGSDNTLDKVCKQSGFDGHEHIKGIDYCYFGEGIDTMFVPLLVSTPVPEEE